MRLKQTKLGRISLALVALIGTVLLINTIWSKKEYAELQRRLGTNQNPVAFIAQSLKPGMTREEVRQIVIGYRQLESLPSGVSEGGSDLFHYSFGLPLLPGEDSYGTILVSYDLHGRVKDQPRADFN